MDENPQHLEWVLEVLRENKLYGNMHKCGFAKMKVEYLGHIISGKGVEVDPEKIRSIKEWPVPTNVREVRGFLWVDRILSKICNELWKCGCSFDSTIEERSI